MDYLQQQERSFEWRARKLYVIDTKNGIHLKNAEDIKPDVRAQTDAVPDPQTQEIHRRTLHLSKTRISSRANAITFLTTRTIPFLLYKFTRTIRRQTNRNSNRNILIGLNSIGVDVLDPRQNQNVLHS